MAKKPAEQQPEDLETCKTCRFFLLDDPKDEAGFCRRNPPQYVGDEENGGWTFAVITPVDWCGEYVRRCDA
jgi:hypothetical protein